MKFTSYCSLALATALLTTSVGHAGTAGQALRATMKAGTKVTKGYHIPDQLQITQGLAKTMSNVNRAKGIGVVSGNAIGRISTFDGDLMIKPAVEISESHGGGIVRTLTIQVDVPTQFLQSNSSSAVRLLEKEIAAQRLGSARESFQSNTRITIYSNANESVEDFARKAELALTRFQSSERALSGYGSTQLSRKSVPMSQLGDEESLLSPTSSLNTSTVGAGGE